MHVPSTPDHATNILTQRRSCWMLSRVLSGRAQPWCGCRGPVSTAHGFLSPRVVQRVITPISTRRQLLCHAADHAPAGGGDGGRPPNNKLTASYGDDGIGDKGDTTGDLKRRWPLWYTVWIWATAVTYLVWRHKWRKDRKLAAEQLEREHQQEEELRQEWYSFARTYGVKEPPDNGC